MIGRKEKHGKGIGQAAIKRVVELASKEWFLKAVRLKLMWRVHQNISLPL
ncbi:MAG: hypothetical protein GX175_09495 [Halanaerobiaceae bacterium]|nr:hypothetical protein [Halanaerobiaceae bacterium]